MNAASMVLVGLAFLAAPVVLEKDVFEIQTRNFHIPFRVEPNQIGKIDRLQIFVSDDGGKTWLLHGEYEPLEKRVRFAAARDGLHFFATRVRYTTGEYNPPELRGLKIDLKVFVNEDRRPILQGLAIVGK